MPYSNLTDEDIIESADKFFNWLQRKYPVEDVKINATYRSSAYIRKKGRTAEIQSNGRVAEILISIGRPANEVLRSVAHEYKHVLQIYNEGIPIHKIRQKQEFAAIGFAPYAIAEYIKEVGSNW